MCGIAGYVDPRLPPDAGRAVLARMCAAVAHRGPDDEGIETFGGAGLGMRRLSIIDLPGGHQPIANEDGTKRIVFNGEIYNYRELRERLLARGHAFTSRSDTEVILHLYEDEGPACVHRLNGMFAFAIWDSEQRELFAARDRLGVKPFYYAWDGHRLLFASELKALIAAGIERTVNEQAVWDYLTFRYVPQPETIWRAVAKLPPGHTLSLRTGTDPDIQRYWDIPVGPSRCNGARTVEEFSELFLDAVRLRLIADVPVGILLSGGLDSSAVAAAVAEVHNARPCSFSVAFNDPDAIDETPYAREVAAHVGTDHHEVRIGEEDVVSFLPQFVRMTDEPLADLASVPLYYVSALARRHVKVVLSGEGSDEILGGYDFDRVVSRWKRSESLARLPRVVTRAVRAAAGLFGQECAGRVERAVTPPGDSLDAHPPVMTNCFDFRAKQRIWQGTPGLRDSLEIVRNELRRTSAAEPLNRVLYSYCQSWLVEDLLMKADKMTMANSLELRVPFLDYRLVEWASSQPAHSKVGLQSSGAGTKLPLRAFAAGRLPRSILHRPKQGFPVPMYGWLHHRLRRWAHDLLGGDIAISRWLRPATVRAVLEAGTAPNARAVERHRLWNLLILELWTREWNPS